MILVTTELGALFLCRCKGLDTTTENLKAAQVRIYYLATRGVLTKHGGAKRGQARWDLRELVRDTGGTTDVMLL